MRRAGGRCAVAAGLLLWQPNSVRAQALPLLRPAGVAYDSAGNLFVADANRNQIIEITLAGTAVVIAGNGTQGFSGDGSSPAAAELNSPQGVAIGSDASVYIADTGNQRIRVVRNGQITTFAGTGAKGFAGDGGAASAAVFDQPVTLALDSAGALLICDQHNQRVRRVMNGIISTVAGDGIEGYSGDGSAAAVAELNEPSGVAIGADGRIYIADTGNHRIRVVTTDGLIATFAGNGTAGFSGDGAQAISAALNRPRGLTMDAAGNLFIADENNHRLRRVTPGGSITTVVGSGVQGKPTDGALASASAISEPGAAGVSAFGWPLLADPANRSLWILLDDGRLYAPAVVSSRLTQLTASAPNAVYGAARETVAVTSSPSVPRGSVEVLDGAEKLGEVTLTQTAASVPLMALGAGSHTLTTVYSGDGVHPAATAATTITVSPAPVVASAAAATATYGAALPSFTGSLSGVLPQDAGHVSAVFSVTAAKMPATGSYPIAASLAGPASANYSVTLAASSGTLIVVPAATNAALTPPTSAYAGLPLQLRAQVASTTSGVPTGSVSFLDGGSVVASAPLSGGWASTIYLNPAAGAHALSVAYSGDTNFLPSSSMKLTASVTAMPDFGVSVAGNSQQTVLAGTSANYTLSVAPSGAPFTGAVTFSASGLPVGATASFSPPAVVPGASAAAVTMTISTTSQTARLHRSQTELVLALAGCLMLPIFGRRRRVLSMVVFAGAGMAFALCMVGCGARTTTESTLAVQSYNITVKGTSTNLAGNVVVHSVNLTLGVQ